MNEEVFALKMGQKKKVGELEIEVTDLTVKRLPMELQTEEEPPPEVKSKLGSESLRIVLLLKKGLKEEEEYLELSGLSEEDTAVGFEGYKITVVGGDASSVKLKVEGP